MLHVLYTEAARAAAQGGEIQIADAVRVCLAAGLTALILRQVLSLASALASGMALQSYGVLSHAAAWSAGGTAHNITQFSRGLAMDRETTRWDPISRKVGYGLKRGLQRLYAARPRIPNSISVDPKVYGVEP